MYFLIKIWGAEDRTYASFKFFVYNPGRAVSGCSWRLRSFIWRRIPSTSSTCAKRRLRENWARPSPSLWPGFTSERASRSAPRASDRCYFGARSSASRSRCPSGRFTPESPDAHTQAPTGGSMLLAAILLKMGVYGFLRIILPIFPDQVHAHVHVLLLLAAWGEPGNSAQQKINPRTTGARKNFARRTSNALGIAKGRRYPAGGFDGGG